MVPSPAGRGLTRHAGTCDGFLKMRRPRWVVWVLVLLLALHLNYWMWADSSLVAGLPVNLLYHVVLCLGVPVVMLFVVRSAWPRS